VATCADDKTVKIWNISSSLSCTLIRTYAQHSSPVYALEWLDSNTVASSGYGDKTIQLWSVSTGQTKRTISTGSYTFIYSLKLLNNQIHLAAGCYYTSYDVNIYSIIDGSLVASLKGHSSNVYDLLQVNNSNLLISSSQDKSIKVWDTAAQTCKFTLYGHIDSVRGLKMIGQEILSSGSGDGTIKLWNLTSALEIRTLYGHTGAIYYSLDLMNNGQTLVSGGDDKTIKLWNWSTGQCLQTIQTNSTIYSLAFVINEANQQLKTTTKLATQMCKIFKKIHLLF